MADISLITQTTPAAPAATEVVVYPDSGNKLLTVRDSTRVHTLGSAIRNWNVADVVANAADTYLTGSRCTVPQHLMQAGTVLRWKFVFTKTAAGVAAPVWVVRVGTAGTTADAAILTFTSPSAQTAATDTGTVELWALLRNTGAAGVLTGGLVMTHANQTTGLASVQQVVLAVTSAGFDTTVANTLVGVSVNPGAAGVWTHTAVYASMENV